MAHRPSRPRAPALILALLATAGSAGAQEWQLNGNFSQRVEADSNKRVDPENPGGVIGFTTGLDLALQATTQRTTWNLDGGVRAQEYFGEGADSDLNRIDPSLSGSVEYKGRRYQTTSGFSLTRRATSLTEFEDTAVVNQDITTTTVSLNSGVLFLLDPLNQLGVNAFGNIRRFSEVSEQFAPSTTYGVSTTWSHDLTRLTSTDFTLGVRQFDSDGVTTDLQSTILNIGTRVNHSLTEQINLGVGAGVNINRTQRSEAGLAQQDDLLLGFSGDASIKYRTDDTEFQFAASQGLEPSSDGELNNRTNFSVSVDHRLTSFWNLNVTTSYTRQTAQSGSGGLGADTPRQVFTFAPSLSTPLTEDWRLQFGYALRLVDSASGGAASNNVFMGVSRDLAFFP